MKLAYIGYDKTALRTHPILEQYFTGIDSYLVNPNTEASDLDLLSLSIMANNVYIPSEVVLQTTQHKLVLQEIKKEYLFLKKNILSGYNLPNEELTGTKKSVKRQFNIEDMAGVTFNKNRNKHLIQTESQEFTEYDYLIIEGHQLVSEALQEKVENIIRRPQVQSYVMLNLEFSIQYKFHKQYLHHEFIFIDNICLKTIFDNWYLCSLSQNKISVGLYIPYEQHRKDEFLDFITNRTHEMLCRSFESFNIGELLRRRVSASDGFFTKCLKLNYPKNSSVFPSFSFWSQNKINDYIKNVFVAKNKKNRNLFAEREIS